MSEAHYQHQSVISPFCTTRGSERERTIRCTPALPGCRLQPTSAASHQLQSPSYRDRPIVSCHAVHGQKPCSILYKAIRQDVTVQVVDEPAVRGIPVHLTDKTNQIRVVKVMGERRTKDKICLERFRLS